MTSAASDSTAASRAIASFDQLHPAAVTDTDEIGQILDRLCRERVLLWRGMNRRIDRETATIVSLRREVLILQTRNFEPGAREAIFLNFALDRQPYFFSAPFEAELGNDRVRVGRPISIYRAERRSRVRRPPCEGESHRVALLRGAKTIGAEIEDASPEGMGIQLFNGDLDGSVAIGENLRVRLLDGPEPGREFFAEVRSFTPVPQRRAWTRIGLDVSSAPRASGLVVERRAQVLPTTGVQRASRGWKIASAGLRVATDRALTALGRRPALPSIHVVDYKNDNGELIRGIVDSWGDTRGATAVVIPPAWGRTKETLMPLAATIVAGFRAANEPVVVLRFDGIRKRGESYNDSACRVPGREHHRFTFSQGVSDIAATLDFLEKSPEFMPTRSLLVSFSAASIESRRAVAIDPRIDGWVCVVGAADAQSMMRVISGGVDYVGGVEREVRFGLQEVLGVEVDIDHAGKDVFQHRLACLSDSRRDFASIVVPVTWIHGIHDAWMDAERARDALSRGYSRNRRFLEIPTGHMLKNSREALETFQLVTAEVSRMALGTECPRALPDLRELSRRQQAERQRLPRGPVLDLRNFWKDYLVGREENLGIELMTHTSSYTSLMAAQVEALDLQPGQLVADLGSGTGSFPVFLSRTRTPRSVRILELDYVRAGFERARVRLRGNNVAGVSFVEADLDLTRGRALPIANGSLDSALAGFFLSYVEDPLAFLRDVRRVLKPSGRLVVSSLRRDADVSKLYTEGIAELRVNSELLTAEELHGANLDVAARDYLNQASKLLDLEEAGRFHFWDGEELCSLVAKAGFTVLRCEPVFGDPAQAVLVSAIRR